jgi:hypothetical protein
LGEADRSNQEEVDSRIETSPLITRESSTRSEAAQLPSQEKENEDEPAQAGGPILGWSDPERI